MNMTGKYEITIGKNLLKLNPNKKRQMCKFLDATLRLLFQLCIYVIFLNNNTLDTGRGGEFGRRSDSNAEVGGGGEVGLVDM